MSNLVDLIKQRHNLTTESVGIKSLTSRLTLEDGIVGAQITNDNVDEQMEVLLPKGMMGTDFVSNGTIFWNHNYNIPLGKPLTLKPSADGKAWNSTFKFAERPPDAVGEQWDHLDWVKSLVAQGIVRGVSVGFLSQERRAPTKADRERFGDTVKMIHSKWKLLEYSVTPIPVNQSAIISYAKSHPEDQRIIQLAAEAKIDLSWKPKKYICYVPRQVMKDQAIAESERQVLKHLGVLYRS